MVEKCIICNSTSAEIFRNKSFMKFPVKFCQDCKLYFSFSKDSEILEFNRKYYSKDYWGKFRKKYEKRIVLNFIIRMLRIAKTKPLLQTWHHRLMVPYLPRKNLLRFLDIGCGGGDFCFFLF